MIYFKYIHILGNCKISRRRINQLVPVYLLKETIRQTGETRSRSPNRGVYWYSVEWQHWTQTGGSKGTRRATCRTNNSIFSCSCCIPVQHGMYVELYVCREHFNTLFGNNFPIYVTKLRCTDL